jgi:hypothetical protein
MDIVFVKTKAGDVRIHAPGCADVNREGFAIAMPLRYDSLKEVIEFMYEGYEDLDNLDGWRTIAEDIKVLPCCELPTT